MRLEEATIFLKSFRNKKSNPFVQKMMVNHYSEAIIQHHPEAGTIDKEDIRKKCISFVEQVFSKINSIKYHPEKLFPLLYRLSRKNPEQDNIWFHEFDEAYENYKHNKKLYNRLEQLKPYLQGSSYCDIGCGGGDLIAFLKNQYPQFKTCSGIDVLDWRTDDIKEEINFQMIDLSKPGTRSAEKYDLLTCLAVLHHVGRTEEEVVVFLQNILTAMNEDSRLIVEEDVLLPEYQIKKSKNYSEQVRKLSKDQNLFPEFLSFSEEDQRDITILIDFLANSLSGGVPDMSFPCGFRSLDEWTQLFSNNGYKVEDVKILGFVSGVFNRSGHTFFILKPKNHDN